MCPPCCYFWQPTRASQYWSLSAISSRQRFLDAVPAGTLAVQTLFNNTTLPGADLMKAIHVFHMISVVLAFAAALAAPERCILWSMAIVMLVHHRHCRTTPLVIAVMAPTVFEHARGLCPPDHVLAAAAYMFFFIGYELQNRRGPSILWPADAVSKGHRTYCSALAV